MTQGLRIYGRYLKMNLLSGLEYKGWWLMLVQTALVTCADPLCLVFLFSRFGGIGVWTMERILLVYAMAVASFGLAELFCRGFDYFPWRMIQSGEFDRVLLRPRSVFLQIAGTYFHLHRFGRVLSGLVVICWALARLGIAMTFGRAALLALALAGGMLMYSGVFVASSGIAFFTVKALDWIYIFTNASYFVLQCPAEFMPRVLRNLFTFFMPMLVISYYPASAICGWGESAALGLLALPAGAAFLGVSMLVFRFGARHYASTGS